MSFLAPDNLIWAVVAGLVVLLYVVRLGGRRQKVSSYLLWQRALARRSAWSRWWQWWVSLTVALVFVGLLVLALMRPFGTAAAERARHIVFVIDSSASMNATDVEPSRLAMAKTHARQIVDRLEPNERAAVVSAGARVEVHCGFTQDPDRIRAALDTVRASEGPTRIVEAVALARRMVEQQENRQVIILTDGAYAAAEGLAAANDLDLVVVAGEPDNVGITRLAMRPNHAGESPRSEFFVEVTNVGSQPVECTLVTRLEAGGDDELSHAAGFQGRLEIPAGGSTTTTVPLGTDRAGLVTVQIERDDHLAADNRAQLLVPALTPRRLVVVAGSESPVVVALRGLGDAEVQVVDALPDDVDTQAVTVFHGRVPESLPPGPTLVIEPDASCDLWQLDDGAGVAHRVSGRVAHVSDSPLLAGVDLSRAVLEEKVALEVGGDFEPLVIDESDQPLYLLVQRPDVAGPVLVFTARLSTAKSDLTLRTDFPLLLANAVRWLGGPASPVYEAASTSDLVSIDPSSEPRTLLSPDGRTIVLPAGQPFVGPLARGGLWSVAAADPSPTTDTAETAEDDGASSPPPLAPPESVIAVSLVDVAESDIRPRLDPTTAAEDNLLRGGPSSPLWLWLVGLAVLISLVEWYLYHRRVLV